MARIHFVTLTTGNVRIEQAIFREHLLFAENRHDLVMRYSPSPGFGLERLANGEVKTWHDDERLSSMGTVPITSNLNKITAEFLVDKEADFLLVISDDQAPQAFNPLDYVDCDKDILGWPTPSCRVSAPNPIPWFPCEPQPGKGLVKSEVVGGGVMLIARRVFEHPAMKMPWKFVYDDDGLFKQSEDFNFCIRAREAGFTVWCDLEHYSLHWKVAEMWRIWQWGTQNTTRP